MSRFTREGTKALQSLAQEVENERKTKGHTPFDDIPESNSDAQSSTSEGLGRTGDSLDELSEQPDPTRAGAFGSATAVRLLRKK